MWFNRKDVVEPPKSEKKQREDVSQPEERRMRPTSPPSQRRISVGDDRQKSTAAAATLAEKKIAEVKPVANRCLSHDDHSPPVQQEPKRSSKEERQTKTCDPDVEPVPKVVHSANVAAASDLKKKTREQDLTTEPVS